MPQQNIITVGYYIIENNVGKLKKDNFIYNNRVDYIYTQIGWALKSVTFIILIMWQI